MRWWKLPFGLHLVRLPTGGAQVPCTVGVIMRLRDAYRSPVCLARMRCAATLLPSGIVEVEIEYNDLVQAVMWRVDEQQKS